MNSIWIDFNNNVPQISCNLCSSCTSLMGVSLCNIQNRGCCYYFPKFTLLDIHRMSKSLKGLNTLELIKNNPNTITKEFALHSKGHFDENRYKKHLEDDVIIGNGLIKDQSVFFKACPFIKPNFGCTIDPEFRSLVCNFFICHEVLDSIGDKNLLERYLSERSSYANWCHWENEGLRHLLMENNINLINNYYKVIEYLQSIPLNIYEFPNLPKVDFNIHELSV